MTPTKKLISFICVIAMIVILIFEMAQPHYGLHDMISVFFASVALTMNVTSIIWPIQR